MGWRTEGRLAPVYDLAKKKHFAKVYPEAAQGKYDIYGLFMQRSLQMLTNGGRFSLVTQGTYLDKEWARGLRKLLASKAQLDFIVDLNPFGQLFFRAMNSPCITSGLRVNAEEEARTCLCVTSRPYSEFHGLDTQQRQTKVVGVIREVLRKLTSKRTTEMIFAAGVRVEQSRLRETAEDRWDLSGGADTEDMPKDWFTAADLLEMRQGVTPGGCLDLFLMDSKKAEHLKIEDALVHKAIKSKQLERWRVDWKDRVLFYPYHIRNRKSEPAFTIPWEEISDHKLKDNLIGRRIEDVLDFDQQIDKRETDIIREAGINQQTVPKLLKHRIALGLVKYPAAALYLVDHYDELEGRVFKKKNIRKFNRRWYEYLWPRDAKIMLANLRIISPTLVRKVRFVLDETGYLSDHACLMIQPAQKTDTAWQKFEGTMELIVGEALPKKDLMRYCLAFMNSDYAQERLVTGHRPTPKGSYAITEAFLKEIPIPSPADKRTVKTIIGIVKELERPAGLPTNRHDLQLEQRLRTVIQELLSPLEG